jgi:hypothetical protein
VAEGLEALLNWANEVLGPLDTLHAPVPTIGVFAASDAEPVEQIDWSVPALETLGC